MINANEGGDYYPFGLTFNSWKSEGGIDQRKKFTTKLNFRRSDFGWRIYMPDVARWFSIDKLAEKYAWLGEYTFVANNPVGLKEIDGRYFDFSELSEEDAAKN